ncbi:MAG: hypothetical protein IME96_04295 [Proteobacteria bacterium]|nr:hypothetical protein [Pseudomonadota bacterium]
MAKKNKAAKTEAITGGHLNDDGPPSSPPPSALTDKETRKKVINVVLQILVVIVIMMAMVWGRAYYSQHKFFKEGEAALKSRDFKEAITGYEWTIRMYTPFSGKVKRSCQMLWNIGLEYEKNGRLDWALITYRSLRSSIYAIRSFYKPYEEWIPRTDEKIKRILEIQKMQEGQKKARAEKSN